VLEVLHAERFWDAVLATVYATLLDEDSYLLNHAESGGRRHLFLWLRPELPQLRVGPHAQPHRPAAAH
jgi:hypothetical protein